MSNPCFIALDSEGRVFAATKSPQPSQDLRYFQAKWFPAEVREVRHDQIPPPSDWSQSDDAEDWEARCIAAIRALLDERDALKADIAAAWEKAEKDREALLAACREALRLNHLSDFNPLVNRQSVMEPLRNALSAIGQAEEKK